MRNSGIYTAIFTIELLLTASWMTGGRAGFAPYAMIGLSFLSIFPLIASFIHRRSDSEISAKLLVPWLTLLCLSCISLFNTSFRRISNLAEKDNLWTLQGRFLKIEPIHFLPSTVDAARTLIFLALLTGLMLLSVTIFACIKKRSHIRFILNLICINGFVLSITGIVFKVLGTDKILGFIPWKTNSFFATFRYHNHWGAFILLCLFSSLALFAWNWKKNGKRIANRGNQSPFYLLVSFVFLLTLPISTSRAAILAAVIMTLYLAAVLLLKLFQKNAVTAAFKLLSVFALIICMSGTIFFVSKNFFRGEVLNTKEQIELALSGKTFDLRVPLMRDSVHLILQKPLFGWGYHSFGYIFPLVASDDFYIYSKTKPVRVEFTHNDYLQNMIEFGIIGFLLLISVPITVFLHIRKNGKRNTISFFLFCGIASILIMAMYDFPLSNPAVLAHFVIIFSLAAKYALLSAKTPISNRQTI
jgi:O-antigen ligase